MEMTPEKILPAIALPNSLGVPRALEGFGHIRMTQQVLLETAKLPESSPSFQLRQLLNVDRIAQERDARKIIYRAICRRMAALPAGLSANCYVGEECVAQPPTSRVAIY